MEVAGKTTTVAGNATITDPRETAEDLNEVVDGTTEDPNEAVDGTTEDPNEAVGGTTEDPNETVDGPTEDPNGVVGGTTDERTVENSAERKESGPAMHTTNHLETSEHRGNLNEAMIERM